MQKINFENIRSQLLNDLEKLVKIPSVPEKESVSDNAPFGKPIADVFAAFEVIAKEKGFDIEHDEGYAITASIGKGDAYIGVLGHLDVVDGGDPALWNSAPYQMVEKEGILYGRGVNDDKGPLLAALYAAWLIKQQNLPLRYPIHIIAGGAEETTWECMEHYFQHHQQPLYGFSPDGNFPIVNGEKGILQVRFVFPITDSIRIHCPQRTNYVCDYVEVSVAKDKHFTGSYMQEIYCDESICHAVYKGEMALSRNPQRGVNALFSMVKDLSAMDWSDASVKSCIQLMMEQFVDDFYGKKSGLYSEDESMGTTSVCPMSITCNEKVFELCVDIRYVRTTSKDALMQRLRAIAKQYHCDVEIIRHKRLLFVEEESPLIQSLKKAYKKVMKEDAKVLTKGGASYARVLDCGVAFGASFPNEDSRPHMPNECMSVASLLKACEIYYEALYELAVDET